MELQIYSPTADGFIQSIEWNHEEIKKEVAERVKHYSSLVYTEDQVKEAKADRAKLRKFVEALEAKRKEIKKQCLAPYEAFEKQMKEIIAVVNEPIALIDGQCQEFEDKRKAEKKEAIMAYWYTALEENKIPAGITFEHLFDEKWLNASVKMTAVCKEFNAKLEQIEKDLATLQEMPEFGFEAAEVYKTTLDINKAIAEGKRLADIQKRKAEAEAEVKKFVESIPKEPIEPIEPAEKHWIGFEALLSTEDALALRDFFKARGIEYKAI